MRVLHVAAEAYPLVKTGGLGDVAAALPPAQCAAGAEARLVLPGYPAVLAGLAGIEPVATLPPYAGASDVRLVLGRLPPAGLPTFAVVAPALYERPGDPYLGPDGHDWPDNHRRFAVLGRTAAAIATSIWPADVVHAHDWHAGLAPAYLRARAEPGPASVFTIHNLGHPLPFRAPDGDPLPRTAPGARDPIPHGQRFGAVGAVHVRGDRPGAGTRAKISAVTRAASMAVSPAPRCGPSDHA